MSRKKWIIIPSALVALALVLGAASLAYAQGPQPPEEERDFPSRQSEGFDGRRPGGPGHPRGIRGYSPVEAAVEVTDLTKEEVVAALQEGQTLAEIAEAQGIDPQEIVDAFVSEHETRLQRAVEEGRLTQEQVDEMLEEMTERVTEHLEQPWTPRESAPQDFRGQRMEPQGSEGECGAEGEFAPPFAPQR